MDGSIPKPRPGLAYLIRWDGGQLQLGVHVGTGMECLGFSFLTTKTTWHFGRSRSQVPTVIGVICDSVGDLVSLSFIPDPLPHSQVRRDSTLLAPT